MTVRGVIGYSESNYPCSRLVLVLLVTALLLAVAPAGAKATSSQFEAIDATCNIVPGDVEITGNLLHIRGQINTNIASCLYPRHSISGIGSDIAILDWSPCTPYWACSALYSV